MKKVQLLVVTLLFVTQIFAQTGVIISSEAEQVPNNNAILELKSNIRGFLPPRLTSEDRNTLTANLTTEEEGLEIYNKTRKCKEFWTGTQWTSAVPAGSIQVFAGAESEIPVGWFLCDGQELNRNDYTDLLLAIKLHWGDGDGLLTFNIPDLQDRFLKGKNIDNIGDIGGTIDASHIHTTNTQLGTIELTHNHQVSSHNHQWYGNGQSYRGGQSFSSGGTATDLAAGGLLGGGFELGLFNPTAGYAPANTARLNLNQWTNNVSPPTDSKLTDYNAVHSHETISQEDGTDNQPPYSVINYIIKY